MSDPNESGTTFSCGPGAIQTFQLPVGWQQQPPSRLAGRLIYAFAPKSSPQAHLTIILHEVENTEECAASFQQTLYSPFHDVDTAELAKLSGFLGAITEPDKFQLHGAATGYVNDRRTLRVQGTWLRQGLRSASLFVDIAGNGRQVQQIGFSASAEQFVNLVPNVENVIQSIVWNM